MASAANKKIYRFVANKLIEAIFWTLCVYSFFLVFLVLVFMSKYLVELSVSEYVYGLMTFGGLQDAFIMYLVIFCISVMCSFPAYILGVLFFTVLISKRIKSYFIWGIVALITGGLAYVWMPIIIIFTFPAFILTGIFMCRYAREYYEKLEVDGEAV